MHSLMHVHYSNALSKQRRDTRVNRPSWKREAVTTKARESAEEVDVRGRIRGPGVA